MKICERSGWLVVTVAVLVQAFGLTVYGAADYPPPSPFMRTVQRAADAETARGLLGVTGTNWVFNTGQLEQVGDSLQIKAGAPATNAQLWGSAVVRGTLTGNVKVPSGTVLTNAYVWGGTPGDCLLLKSNLVGISFELPDGNKAGCVSPDWHQSPPLPGTETNFFEPVLYVGDAAYFNAVSLQAKSLEQDGNPDPRITMAFGVEYSWEWRWQETNCTLGLLAGRTNYLHYDPTNITMHFGPKEWTNTFQGKEVAVDALRTRVTGNLEVSGAATFWGNVAAESEDVMVSDPGSSTNWNLATFSGTTKTNLNVMAFDSASGALTNLAAGYYAVSFSASVFQSNDVSDTLHLCVYTNGVAAGMIARVTLPETANKVATIASAPQVFYLPANSYIQLYGRAEAGELTSARSLVLDIVKR